MRSETLVLFCNLIPVLFVVYYLVEGWNKGGLYMLVSLVRLFLSYFIARFTSYFVATSLMDNPVFRARLTSFALEQQSALSQLPGASLLLTGSALESGVQQLAWWLVFAVSFIFIFLVVILFFSVLLKMTKYFNHIPILGLFNRLLGAIGGLIFGTLLTLLIVYFAAFILNLLGYTSISSVLLATWLPVAFRSLIFR